MPVRISCPPGGTYKELDVKLQFLCLLKKGWIESNSFFPVRFGQMVLTVHLDNAQVALAERAQR